MIYVAHPDDGIRAYYELAYRREDDKHFVVYLPRESFMGEKVSEFPTSAACFEFISAMNARHGVFRAHG